MADSSRVLERFAPSGLRWLGLVALAAVAVAIGLVVAQGDVSRSLDVLVGLAATGLACWVALVRPAVQARDDHLLLRNLLIDVEVPWHLIDSVRVATTLRISAQDRTWHGVAISRSTRSALRAQRPAPSGPSPDRSQVYAPEYTDYVVDQIRRFVDEHAEASQARAGVARRWAAPELACAAVLMLAALALYLT